MIKFWEPIVGFEDYEVSNFGEIRSWKKSRNKKNIPHLIKSSASNKYGHQIVTIRENNRKHTKSVHRLMLEAFRGKRPKSKQSRHLNGNPRDNKLTNLMYGTHQENEDDKIRHGHTAKGSKNGNSKLTVKDVKTIRRMYKTCNFAHWKIGKMFNVCKRTIEQIINRKTWSHI